MSEVHGHAPKHEKLAPVEGTTEAAREHLNALKRRAEADTETHDEEVLESIKADVDTKAISKEDYSKGEAAGENTPAATYISSELKQMGFRRSLNNARRQMSAPAKTLSKVIHQPVVEKMSEAAAPTVARPSGVLGGGIAALLGSSILLYVSKHSGFRYNYLVFILLFVGGFVGGMAVELVVRALIRNKHSA